MAKMVGYMGAMKKKMAMRIPTLATPLGER